MFGRELTRDETKSPPGDKTRVNLFVVSPFSDRDRVVTVHWFLYGMSRFIQDDAKLIVIRPTKIDGKSVEKTFQKFEPTWSV